MDGLRKKMLMLVLGGSYAAFLILDLWWPDHSASLYLKLLSIAACALLAVAVRADGFTLAAAAVTVAADIFLLFYEGYYLGGLLLFFLAHALRLSAFTGYNIARPVFLCAVGLAGLLSAMGLPQKLAFVVVYALLMAALLLCAGQRWPGMILFILCDLCVAGCHVFPRSHPLYDQLRFGMWLFYLPSQVLLLPLKQNMKGKVLL